MGLRPARRRGVMVSHLERFYVETYGRRLLLVTEEITPCTRR